MRDRDESRGTERGAAAWIGAIPGAAAGYALLAMPDAALGLGSYAAPTMLVAMGDPDRATTQPWLPLALAAKVAGDVAMAGRLTGKEITRERALSLWSVLTTAATVTTAVLIVPETRAAARQIVAHYVNSR